MEKLYLETTHNSPKVDFNPETGVLEISGRAIPEDAHMFFKSLFTWVKEYVASDPINTVVEIKLDYLNSSAHKLLMEFFEILKTLHLSDQKLIVKWFYEKYDEEIHEIGEEYANSTGIPFEIIEVAEFSV